MARRGSAPETTSTEVTTEEAPVSTSTDEVVEAVTETTETPETEAVSTATETAPAADKEPVDLTAFTAVVDQAVSTADTSTGEVPEAGKSQVTAAYRELDAAGKRAAKSLISDKMREFVLASDIAKARSYMTLNDSLSAGATKTATPKAPADPIGSYVDRAAVLRLAYAAMPTPDGIDSSANDRIQSVIKDNDEAVKSYVSWLTSDAEDKGEAPEASALVVAAAKLAVGKSSKAASGGSRAPFEGTRRNIAKHIEEAFANEAVGTFLKIAEIKNFKSSEYGDDSPSAGAISARLFPSSGKVGEFPNFKPSTNESGDKGATRI
jgi:hypothetical protein